MSGLELSKFRDGQIKASVFANKINNSDHLANKVRLPVWRPAGRVYGDIDTADLAGRNRRQYVPLVWQPPTLAFMACLKTKNAVP